MQVFIIHTIRFVLFLFAQALLLNQLEVGFGIHVMIYPLFILLLPYNINIFLAMLISFALGMGIDSISNTYGLHASSALLLAYLRPTIFKMFEPRDGYENVQEFNMYEMNRSWLFSVFGIMLLVHHLWFFSLELFKFNEIGFILQKTILSVPFSMLACILIQLIFIRRPASSR
ncbi:MAG: hypothetical protein E6Q37_02030 [Crocinitomicaceae bacterium]|nr:MAG: hypothetical protein E6Q37_02030 [Crocinitomicaceae bacterium]